MFGEKCIVDAPSSHGEPLNRLLAGEFEIPRDWLTASGTFLHKVGDTYDLNNKLYNREHV